MPWTYQSSKDGFTVADIPDDVEIGSPEFVQLVTTMRGKSDSIGSAPATPPQETPQPEGPGFLDRMVATAKDIAPGIVRGAAPIVAGAAGGAALGAPFAGVGAIPGAAVGAGGAAGLTLIGDPAAALINSIAGEQVVTGPTEFVGDLLDRMGLARPETAAGRMAQATAQGVAGAGGMVGAGKVLSQATSPVVRAVGENLAMNVPGQLVGGATGAAASQGAAELGGGTVAQLGAGLVGGLGGGFVGNRFGRTPVPLDVETNLPLRPNTANRVASMYEAEARGIPVHTTDVFTPGPYFGKWAKTIIDKMPFGTGSMNATQANARQRVVDDFIKSVGANGELDDSLGETTKNLLKNRSAEVARNTANKADVLARANEAGPVNVTASTAEFDRQIAHLKSLNSKAIQPAIDQLEDARNSMQNQGILNIEENRATLGGMLKDPFVGDAVKTKLNKATQAIYRALNDDMRAHITQKLGAPDANKWAIANKRLSDMMNEINQGRSRDILRIVRKGADDPEAVKKVLLSGKKSDVEIAYKYLDKDGRDAARRVYVDKAIEVATGKRGINGTDPVSVDKFKTALQLAVKNGGPFFDGLEGQKIQGMIRALDLTVGGARANSLAQTGAITAPFMMGSLYLGDTMGGLKGLATIGSASMLGRAYESPAMRNALIRLAKTEGGSFNESQAINAVMIQAGIAAATEEKRKKGAKK